MYCDNYGEGECTEAEVKVVNAEFEIAAAPAPRV
jgi:hypothetical protein